MSIIQRTTNEKRANDSGQESSGSQGATTSPGKDVVFDVLANERRRHALYYLDRVDGAVEINELAIALAERESDDGTYDHRDRKRMYIALHQSHLPKMADVGIVEYDRRSKRIRLGAEFDYVEPYLYDRLEMPAQWDHLYLAVGLIGVGAVGSGYLWSSTAGSIPVGVWVGMLVGICVSLIAAYLVRSTAWIGTKWLRA